MVTTITRSVIHDVSLVFPRTCRTLAHSITDTFGATGRGKSHVVVVTTLIAPRTFLIIGDTGKLHDVATGRNHVLVQFHIIGIGISPVHISLSVIINEYGGVNVFPMFALPYEGFAQRILIWTVWRIGHQYTDTMSVKRCIEVIFAIACHRLNGPTTIVTATPSEIFQ